MLFKFNRRVYLYALVAVALIFLLSVPDTPAHRQTKEYVKGLFEKEKPIYNPDKWHYQADLDDLPIVPFDFDRLRDLPPTNYAGPGRPTFATFYATRDPTMHDPYFSAAQSIVYRLLWSQGSKSKKYPVTVFVAPFVNETQRQYFTAAGAIVRELPLRPFEPTMKGVPARLQDMFSKLEMWRQLDFSRIAYVDCDAIPQLNIDEIFDFAEDKVCLPDLLPDEDKAYASDICNYSFAAHEEGPDKINAGVMVFKPELAMYRRLVRGSYNTTGWDTGYLEQSLISFLYDPKGPFPPSILGPGYNAFPHYREDGIEIKILHDKAWSHYWDPEIWIAKEWAAMWAEMEQFYRSEEFYRARFDARDQMLAALAQDSRNHPNGPPPEMQEE